MKKTGLILGLVFILLNSVPTLAQTTHPENDPYFISKTTTTLIAVEEHLASPEEQLLLSNAEESIAAVPQDANPMAIADLAFKIWDIIKDGKPVVNIEYKIAKALPVYAQDNFNKLTGWKPIRRLSYNVSTTNGFGITTVDFNYDVILQYGGGRNGKGRYIASAQVLPKKADVKWGYNLDASVEVVSLVNMGTEEDPLAAIMMNMTYKISTILRSYSETSSYEFQGDGLIKSDGKVVYAASSR